MKRKLYMETFGCQMNVLDSDLVLSQLRAQGYELTEDREQASVILYNTCSVREHAEQKVWSRLGELRPRKAADPSVVIGVIGCMAERDATNIFERFPHVDLLCGPGELDKLAGMVHNAVVTGGVHEANDSLPLRARGEGGGEGRDAQTQTDIDSQNASNAFRESESQPTRNVSPFAPARRESAIRPRQTALMGANVRRSSTLEAAEDNLELLDLSRSFSPDENLAQAYVRITRGCNKFCTYCVVPYTRGPEVHRPPGNVIDEVKRLADVGVLEVTLLGQTINHYLFDHGDGRKTTFAELLYRIHESVPHLPRLRFVTSFPRDFTNEALQAMRDCDRICRYLHAPAQHGSDRVLKLMNRGYTVAQYDDFVARAREYMPDVSIASDFIVGFPTETEEEFIATKDLVRRSRFKNSFIFKYSPRPGTTAIDRFPDDVPEAIKKRRNNELLAVQTESSAANNREMIGKTYEVMVEGESKAAIKKASYPSNHVELGWEKKPSAVNEVNLITRTQLVGRTRGDQIVVFDGDSSLKGKLIDVQITDAKNLTLFGKASLLEASVR